MQPTAWNLIVVTPDRPTIEKIRFSCKAALILVVAFVLAFLTTVFLLLMFPRIRVNESDRARLAAENMTLKVQNKNLMLRISRLDAQVSQVEERSHRIAELMKAE